MRATPKQVRCVWSFCVKFGSDGHSNQKWREQSTFDKRSISPIISNIKEFERSSDPAEIARLKAAIESKIGKVFPGFKVTSNPFPEGPEKQKKGAEEKQQDGDGKPGSPSEYDPSKDDSDEDKVRRMLEQLEAEMEEQLPKPEARPEKPVFKTSPGYIKPPEFDAICCALLAGENVLLTGPAGLGKSRLGKEIAYAFEQYAKDNGKEDNFETFVVSFAGGMRYAQMFGSTQIYTDESGNQVSKWVPAPTLQSFQKQCVTVIDEIFSADADANNGLNSVLEPDDRSILTPIGKIERHENNYVLATANANGRSLSNKYTAVNVADTALLDRFVEFPMDYNVDIENVMLLAIGDTEVESYFRDNLDKLRAGIKANNIFFDASTRRLKRAINLYLNAFVAKDEAFERCFLVSLSNAERTKCGF